MWIILLKPGSNNNRSKLKFPEVEIIKLKNENTSLKDYNKLKSKIIKPLTTCQSSRTIVNKEKLHV